jgi:heterotetrameric sarcosine oxidase gamma subunit
MRSAGAAAGCLPRHANGSRAALWLGPDEWLLIAPDGEMPALGAWMADALGDTPASIVDVSDRNLAIEVKGSKAAEAINAFNAARPHPDAFPVGMCTRTVFGKAEIVLWRTAAEHSGSRCGARSRPTCSGVWRRRQGSIGHEDRRPRNRAWSARPSARSSWRSGTM